jgi:hypothetical protein
MRSSSLRWPAEQYSPSPRANASEANVVDAQGELQSKASLTSRFEDGASGRPDLPFATVTGRTVSLISSLIHVRVTESTTVYYRALSRIYRPAWPVLHGHPYP